MLKKRVIPVMLFKDGGLVKGKRFDHSRVVGAVLPAIKVYNARDVDELMLVDVTASLRGVAPRAHEVEWFARECNVPLAVGGGIQNEAQIEEMLRAGADKVVLNTVCYAQPELISSASKNFGTQCIVVSIDYRAVASTNKCFSHAGRNLQDVSVSEWALRVAELGAGEILLTNCERDGMMGGYDVETIQQVSELVNVPVIASGGAGRLDDFVAAIQKGRADAVAAGSLFHFTETTPRAIKEHLASAGVAVRLGVSP